MKSVFIAHARVIDPANHIDAVKNIYIQDGKIADISDTEYQADIYIDASGLAAAPGLVDMHVHLRDPGFTAKEDILTGCNAACAGGVTSLLAMPNTNPVVDSPEVVEYIRKKSEKAKAKVYITASVTKGLKSRELCNIEELAKAGAIALSDDGRPVENTKFMAQAMIQAPKNNMCVVAHCEDLYLADGGKMNEGEVSRKLGVKGIPRAAEDTGTAREIALAAAYDVPIHICHVSTKTSVALIRDAKARGVKVTAETAPHYISLTEKALLTKDADFRMNPPKSDFEKAPNGSIGMETSLSVAITYLVDKGYLTLSQLIEKMSLNPARILHIPAGTLSVGANADVVLFNPDEIYTVDVNQLHGKSKNTPFKNMTLKGKVKYTLLDGNIVYQEI